MYENRKNGLRPRQITAGECLAELKRQNREERTQPSDNRLSMPVEFWLWHALFDIAGRDAERMKFYTDDFHQHHEEFFRQPGFVLAAHIGEAPLRHYLYALADDLKVPYELGVQFARTLIELFRRRHPLPMPWSGVVLEYDGADYDKMMREPGFFGWKLWTFPEYADEYERIMQRRPPGAGLNHLPAMA